MTGVLLGRTNLVVPRVWLALGAPADTNNDRWLEELCSTAVDSNLPIDISSGPGLWGGGIRGTRALLMYRGGNGSETGASDRVAELVQAQLIEVLSAVGRDYLDFFFLRVERAWEESAVDGALRALEYARQEGMVRFLGIQCGHSALATLALWQFHDAFEVLGVTRNRSTRESYDILSGIAAQRRVGVLNTHPLARTTISSLDPASIVEIQNEAQHHPVLVPVSSPQTVELLLRQVLE